ncbi:hypothetical protein FGIG_07156 [Fasciola gigantica]|uniref:Secreted protein n=1 Tax=Fasciola gigantica TaxID=46835 RepID=A0A504YSP7_FASGI|nr:hypothetical protein FGIG_07156 [Fasciola gigantica]
MRLFALVLVCSILLTVSCEISGYKTGTTVNLRGRAGTKGQNNGCATQGCRGAGSGSNKNMLPCMVVQSKADKFVGNVVRNEVQDIADVHLGPEMSCDSQYAYVDKSCGIPLCCIPCPTECDYFSES